MRDFQEAYKEKPRSPGGGRQDLAALADAFRDFLEGHGLAPATVQARLQGLRVLGCYAQAHEIADLRQMSRSQVDAYVADLRRRKLSPRTVENWLGTCKRFFYFLVETNRLLISPAEHLRERNLSHLMGHVISAKDAERLLSVPNTSLPLGVRDRALLEVLYETGLRRAEVTTLTVFDVDLAGALLRVQHGKGGKDRLVPLGEQARKWLRTYLENVRPRRPGFCRSGRVAPRSLWLTPSGSPLCDYTVRIRLRRYMAALGLQKRLTPSRPAPHSGAARPCLGGDDADLHARVDRAPERNLATVPPARAWYHSWVSRCRSRKKSWKPLCNCHPNSAKR